MIICGIGQRQVQEEGECGLGPSQPCLVVTGSPSLRQVLDVDLVLQKTQPLLLSGSCSLPSRPGTVRVSLVKVLLEGRGLSEPQNLALIGAQSDVTCCALRSKYRPGLFQVGPYCSPLVLAESHLKVPVALWEGRQEL